MRIVRFLDYGAAKSLLEVEEESSTFLLRSLKYYQGLEAARSIHAITDPDSMESKAEFEDSRTHYEFLDGVLVSCWCLTNESQPYSSQLPFRTSHAEGIAVVSTVDSVAKFLEVETKYLLPGWNFRHERVRYYSEARHPKDYDVSDAMFWKRERYRTEREYRFAFVSSSRRGHLHTLVFYATNPKDYIHEIHFGSALNSNQRKRLMAGAIGLEVANTIYDFDGEVERLRTIE